MCVGKENKMSKVLLVFAILIAIVKAMIDCDSCIRKHGQWCPGEGCLDPSGYDGDRACQIGPFEPLIQITEKQPVPGDLVHPMSAEKIIPLFSHHDTVLNEIYYKSPEKVEDVSYNYNTRLIIVTWNDEPVNATHRRLSTAAKVKKEFCSETTSSDIVVRVGDLGTSTHTILVSCSCQCSNASIPNASDCNSHGLYSCGVCFCDNDWEGTRCEKPCRTRGDVQAPEYCENAPFYTGKEKACNGNGYCSCSSCKCSESTEGSQYFSYAYNCIDVCTATLPCDKCLLNGSLGDCEHCYKPAQLIPDFQFKIEELNMTKAKHDKVLNRYVWVHCHKVIEDCEYDYYAMKESNTQTYVAMITNNTHCSIPAPNASGGTGGKPAAVPLIIGICLGLLMLALISAFIWYKYGRPIPPQPTSNSQYANIEAEDCTGENPLYKPPTSSFKNPTYGKW